MTPYKMVHAGLIKSSEAPTNEFQKYIENRNIPSLVTEKIETIYSPVNKKLYATMDMLDQSPNEALKLIIENNNENTFSPNDIKYVGELLQFLKDNHKNVHPDLLKRVECRLAFNNLERLKELNCLYIEASTYPIKKYLEQGGSMIINDQIFDQDNLPEKIYSADEKYQIHFVSNTQASFTSMNYLNKELNKFKEPMLLISGKCDNFKIQDSSIIAERNKIYFSANCIAETFNPEKPKNWIQRNKTALTIAGGVALIAAGIYLKDKRVVFQKQIFSF